MKEENNNTNNINQQTGSNNVESPNEVILEKLLQQGEIVIQNYKISLKNYKHHKSLTMEELRENLQKSIKFYNKVGRENELEFLPQEALPLVEKYKNESFQLNHIRIVVKKNEEDDEERLFKNYLHINFSSLKALKLQTCILKNIESISFINAPFLKFLDLSRNKLSNINALIKSHFPQLAHLSIDDNYIQETEKLSRFNSNRLKAFYNESCFNKRDQKQIPQDVRFLLKFIYELQPKEIYLDNPYRNTELIKNIVTKLNRKGNSILFNNEEAIRF